MYIHKFLTSLNIAACTLPVRVNGCLNIDNNDYDCYFICFVRFQEINVKCKLGNGRSMFGATLFCHQESNSYFVYHYMDLNEYVQ